MAGNGWDEHRKLVVAELERLNNGQDVCVEKMDALRIEMVRFCEQSLARDNELAAKISASNRWIAFLGSFAVIAVPIAIKLLFG